jgi:hypothetical protein
MLLRHKIIFKIKNRIARFLRALLYKIEPRTSINLGSPEFKNAPRSDYVHPIDRELAILEKTIERGGFVTPQICKVDLAVKQELDAFEEIIKQNNFMSGLDYILNQPDKKFIDFRNKFYGLPEGKNNEN